MAQVCDIEKAFMATVVVTMMWEDGEEFTKVLKHVPACCAIEEAQKRYQGAICLSCEVVEYENLPCME